MLSLARRSGAVGLRPVLAVLVTLCLVAAPARAQDTLLFDTWTIEDGLPQNSVNDIVQTPDGYLWLATYGGLVRFDGVRFVVFDRSVEGVDSIRTRALHVDRSGTLWAGTDDGALLRYRDGRFSTFDADDGLIDGTILRIEDSGDGAIWITWTDTVTRFDGQRFLHFGPGDLAKGVRPHPPVNGFYLAHGVWWNTQEDGAYCLIGGQVERCLPAEVVSPESVAFVGTDQDQSLWFVTSSGRMLRQAGETLHEVELGGPVAVGTQVTIDRTGAHWILESGRLRRRRGIRTSIVPVPLPHNLFEDREGSLWIGSLAGLHRFRVPIITGLTTDHGLSENNVYPILRDREGRIWVGTQRGGLNRIEGDRVTSYDAGGSLDANVAALFEDSHGRVLVGTSAGVKYFDRGELLRYSDPSGWLAGRVVAIHEDAAGYWFATEAGLVRQVGDRFERLTTAEGLPHDRVTALFEDRAGTLWVGTPRGLVEYRDGAVATYTEAEGFIGNQVRAFLQDESGVLWIGTYDGGLYRLDAGRLTRYTTQQGLHDNGVFHILEDDRGYFWISSNRGIYRVRRSELDEVARGIRSRVTSLAFGRRDGMPMVECNGGTQPAGARMPDGTFWFPTQGGVAIVDPRAVVPNSLPPPVALEEIRLGDQAVAVAPVVDVPPDRHPLAIRYTALTLVRSEQTVFRYRLAGLDDDWIDAGSRRDVTYYRIPAGEYRFEVIAVNSDGVPSGSPASVRIVVHAPFWRRTWFLALSSFAMAAVAVLTVRRRLLGLRREQARQHAFARQLIETQEQERRRISNELHDALGQDLFMIKTRARASRQDSAESPASEALQSIEAMATESYAGLKRIAHGLRPYQLDKIGLSRTIDNMLQRVAETCEVRFEIAVGQVDDCFSPDAAINVFRIVQEAVNNVIRHADARYARVRVDRAGAVVELVVADDGRGFDVTSPAAESGFGLMGVRERAQALGGTLSLDSTPGRGTVLRVTLPVEESRHG